MSANRWSTPCMTWGPKSWRSWNAGARWDAPAEWHTHTRLERTLLELAENIGVIKWEEN